MAAAALVKDAQVPDTTPNLINRAITGAGGTTQRSLAAGCIHWLAANATELKLIALVVAGVALANLFS
jgi:hypothetical protein